MKNKTKIMIGSSKPVNPKESGKLNIFIVHGHDNAMKDNVSKFLKDLGHTPVILHQQINKGKTLIEKFEAHSDVGFAIILMSPDDDGKSSLETTIKKRARQNVVFEFGYFIGKLGRDKVCVLIKDNVERPSDIDGFVYIPYKKGQWRNALKKELNEIATITQTKQRNLNKMEFYLTSD